MNSTETKAIADSLAAEMWWAAGLYHNGLDKRASAGPDTVIPFQLPVVLADPHAERLISNGGTLRTMYRELTAAARRRQRELREPVKHYTLANPNGWQAVEVIEYDDGSRTQRKLFKDVHTFQWREISGFAEVR